AMAPHTHVRDTQPRAVDPDKPVDVHRRRKELLYPSEIAEAFLADRRHEGERAGSLNAGLAQRLDDRDEHGQAPAVATDPWAPPDRAVAPDLHVSVLRKDR